MAQSNLHVAGSTYISYRTMIRQTVNGLSIGNITDYSSNGRTTGRHQKLARVHSADVLIDNVPQGCGDLFGLAVLRQTEYVEAMIETGDIVLCPNCNALNAYAYRDSNIDNAQSSTLVVKDKIYHIPAASCFDWQCGKCGLTFASIDSPINAEVYTHVDPYADNDD